MYTKLDICNRALRLIGENLLTTLDEKTKTAEECKFLYPIVKREVIETYPWQCTRKIMLLKSIYDLSRQETSTSYSYKFILPFDCIRVLSVDDSNNFKKDGIYLYAPNKRIKIAYTADIDEQYMTLRLCKIISLKLALELVFALVGETALINRLNTMLNQELQKLTQLDSLEGGMLSPEPHLNNTDDWLSSRL